MKMNTLLRKAMTIVVLLALGAATLTSCTEKDPDPTPNPDPNTNTIDPNNICIYNGDTAFVVSVSRQSDTEGYVAYNFSMNNSDMFELSNFGDLTTGAYNLGFSDDCLLSIFLPFAEETLLIVDNGSLEVAVNGDTYTFDINATLVNGKVVTLHYSGKLIDINQSNGNGTFTIGGNSYNLNFGLHFTEGEHHVYELLNNVNFDNVYFGINKPLTNKVYTIIDNTDSLNDNSVVMEFSVGEDDYYAISGTLQCAISGDTYTLTFSGNTDDGAFSGSYTGKIAKLMKSAKGSKRLVR